MQNQQLAASSDSEATKSSSEEANQQGAGEPTEGTGLLDKSESEMHLTPSIVNTTKVTGIIIQVIYLLSIYVINVNICVEYIQE